MTQSPEDSSIHSIGEALTDVIDGISPAFAAGIEQQVTAVQQDVESIVGSGSEFASDLLSRLGMAATALTGATEAQTSATNEIESYLERIGFDALVETAELALAANPAPRPTFRERSGPKDKFFGIGEDGTIRPRDPLTGEIMWPGEIPKSLLADPELKQGFEFWKKHGPDVAFKLLLCSHSSAKDLLEADFDLNAVAKRLGRSGDPLYLEGVGRVDDAELSREVHNRFSHSTKQQLIEGGDAEDIVVVDQPLDNFSFQILNQIMATGVDVVNPDYYADGKRPADVALAAWRREVRGASAVHGEALRVGYIFYRNAYLIGKMGADLARRHAATGEVPSSAALLIGNLHEGIAIDLRRMGVTVRSFGEPEAEDAYLLDCICGCATSAEGIAKDFAKRITKGVLGDLLGKLRPGA
ncbi:MAG TPA: hypothetical protein VMR45_00265 [Patescibacteria group bacterium]|nr:hypothetical protein [Patescibacteria group bacterium]